MPNNLSTGHAGSNIGYRPCPYTHGQNFTKAHAIWGCLESWVVSTRDMAQPIEPRKLIISSQRFRFIHHHIVYLGMRHPERCMCFLPVGQQQAWLFHLRAYLTRISWDRNTSITRGSTGQTPYCHIPKNSRAVGCIEIITTYILSFGFNVGHLVATCL